MKQSRVTSEVLRYGAKRTKEIYGHLRKDNLWKRMVKNIVATTIAGMKSSMGSVKLCVILHCIDSEHLSYTWRAFGKSRLSGCYK